MNTDVRPRLLTTEIDHIRNVHKLVAACVPTLQTEYVDCPHCGGRGFTINRRGVPPEASDGGAAGCSTDDIQSAAVVCACIFLGAIVLATLGVIK